MAKYDVIVIGTGGVGSAALYHLAKRGMKVIGLDRFPAGHDKGSSHGQTRLIRQAYFEHSDYVPLVKKAYKLWHILEAQSGQKLFEQSGVISIGPKDGELVAGVLRSAKEHELNVESLSSDQVKSRWPGIRVPKDSVAVFEPKAGFLHVEKCVLAHLNQATEASAELRTGVNVTGWSSEGTEVKVTTEDEDFTANHLVISAGAWAGSLLSDLGLKMSVKRKHLHWYQPIDSSYLNEQGCCGFLYETPEGYFYGFPQIDDLGVKVAEHTNGTIIEDPLTDDKSIEQEDCNRVESFVRNCLPNVSTTATNHSVCYYTMSPDEHFTVDRHPKYENVVFAAGLSGHGFKFTPVLGQALAALIIDGETDLPIQFLSCSRDTLKS